MKRQTLETRHLRTKIAVGNMLILLLLGSIIYTWQHERSLLTGLETENRRIKEFREEIHNVHVHMTELSLLGENMLGWEDEDMEEYRRKRLETDSLLCRFKDTYPTSERIDSVCCLLEEKEGLLRGIMQVFNEQTAINDRIAEQVPLIAEKNRREEPKKARRKGLFGIFGRKEETPPSATATMLHSLNRDMIAKQREQSRLLSAHADSLAARNILLNRQLQTLIRQMNAKAQGDFQKRESEISALRERSLYMTGGLTGFVILLLLLSYVVIHMDYRRIRRYKAETAKLIRKQKQMLAENTDLLNARQKMMHTIIHELRIPLSTIMGYNELLDEETDEEKQRQYKGNIRQASERMATQLDTLLSFFRLDCGKEEMNLVPFRLTDIADTLGREFRARIEAKNIDFVVKNCGDCVVIGDKERIIQIGDNLLSNAVKFTNHGCISLITSYRNGIFSLDVTDTGIGMPKADLNRIFKSFERLSNAATKEGFGLGLSIVDSLVRLLGGKIRIDSDAGAGTNVSVDIPVTRTDERMAGGGLHETIYPKRNYSVVAIDNNVVTLDMIKAMFAGYDVPCDTCMNAGKLMELIRHKRYDLLITDLRMPGLNGYDILELLRTSDVNNSKTISVIVATASGSCTREELLEKGFSDCIFKPFSKQDLIEVADRNVTGKEKTDDEPDFTPILAYGDETEMLDKLISATEEDMRAFKDAGERKDLQELDELIHHLHSSWGMLHTDKPLWKLHELLNSSCIYNDAELQEATNAVLETGETIIRCAGEKKKEVANG